MFVVVVSSVIRVSTPVNDVNLAQTAQEKLQKQKGYNITMKLTNRRQFSMVYTLIDHKMMS